MAHPDPLLLALAAGHAVTGERDSRGLVDSAVEHRMTGLLWSAVERGEVVLPPDERQRLSVVDMANRLREQQIERALVEAVRTLSTIRNPKVLAGLPPAWAAPRVPVGGAW